MEEKASPSSEDWQLARAAAIDLAIEREDLLALWRWSAEPGGFGDEKIRQKAWSYLLGVRKQGSEKDENVSVEEVVESESKAEEAEQDEEVTKTSKKEDIPETSPDLIPFPKDLTCSNETVSPHSDEGQVLLDTKRSFVFYPEGISPREKLRLQGELNDLIVTILRRRKGLSYFQGYHDIISVFYLTFFPYQNEEPKRHSARSASPHPRSRKSSKSSDLARPGATERKTSRGHSRSGSLNLEKMVAEGEKSPGIADKFPSSAVEETMLESAAEKPERARGHSPKPLETEIRTPPVRKQDTEKWKELEDCCDALSLLRIRDAMGHTLAPVVGYLRLFKRLVKASDPELAKLVLSVSPTPYFALSWILTLFSHDLNVLEPTQRIFDFFLPRNPGAMIYLGVAIILLKKKRLLELKDTLDTDPGILHSYLSLLPPLIADTPTGQAEIISVNPKLNLSNPSSETYVTSDGPNPLEAVKLSELFTLTDSLWNRLPLTHDLIRAQEILAPKSVIFTYNEPGDQNKPDEFSMEEANIFLGEEGFKEEKVVITPALPETDDETETSPPTRPKRPIKSRSPFATLLGNKQNRIAVVVLVVGISFALYTAKRRGRPHRLMLDNLGIRVAEELDGVQNWMGKWRSSPVLRESIKRVDKILAKLPAFADW